MALFETKKQSPGPVNVDSTPDKTKHGLFTSTKQGVDPQEILQLSNQISDLARRQRMTEERTNNLRRTMQVIEQNMISNDKQHTEGIRLINIELNEIHKEIEDMKEKMRLIIKELKMTAKIEDVKIMNKYFEMWNPVKFITQDEIDSIIERKLLSMKNPKNI